MEGGSLVPDIDTVTSQATNDTSFKGVLKYSKINQRLFKEFIKWMKFLVF